MVARCLSSVQNANRAVSSPPLFHAAQQYLRVAGRTPFPDIDVHSLPVALQHACGVGTLVVVPDTGPDVGVQQVGRHAGRMAVDGLVAEEGDFLHDFRTAFGYVVVTHHFAQPGHVGAFGEFPHRIGEELARAVGVEHGGGDARRNGGENTDGAAAASSRKLRSPSAPATFTTSCGSAITHVVPCGSTASPKAAGSTMLDSMCTCASTKPAVTTSPVQSSVSASAAGRPSPTAAIRPSRTSTSARETVSR